MHFVNWSILRWSFLNPSLNIMLWKSIIDESMRHCLVSLQILWQSHLQDQKSMLDFMNQVLNPRQLFQFSLLALFNSWILNDMFRHLVIIQRFIQPRIVHCKNRPVQRFKERQRLQDFYWLSMCMMLLWLMLRNQVMQECLQILLERFFIIMQNRLNNLVSNLHSLISLI